MKSRRKHQWPGKWQEKVLFRNLQILGREVLTWIDRVGKLPNQNCIASQPPGWCHTDINVMALNNVILKPWPNFPHRIPTQMHFPHWHKALNGYYGGRNNQKQTSFSPSCPDGRQQRSFNHWTITKSGAAQTNGGIHPLIGEIEPPPAVLRNPRAQRTLLAIAGEAVTGTPVLMNPPSGHFHINIRLLGALDMVALAEKCENSIWQETGWMWIEGQLKLKAKPHKKIIMISITRCM